MPKFPTFRILFSIAATLLFLGFALALAQAKAPDWLQYIVIGGWLAALCTIWDRGVLHGHRS
jgi:hypothetical protein